MPMLGKCMIFKKFHAWRNARACIKCSSWMSKKMAKNNTWHANQIHASFLLAKMDDTLAINACHFLWLDKFHKSARALEKKGKKKKRKIRYSTVWNSSTIKKLDFRNIEYHIIFLITQILGQQCHTSDSLETRVH